MFAILTAPLFDEIAGAFGSLHALREIMTAAKLFGVRPTLEIFSSLICSPR
jgi:hypothetical protein